MAEFCLDCYQKYYPDTPKEKIVISKEYALCEGCGEMKPVVLRYKKRFRETVKDLILNWFYKK